MLLNLIDLLVVSKESRPENNRSTYPVVPKPTQTGGRGRGDFIQKVIN